MNHNEKPRTITPELLARYAAHLGEQEKAPSSDASVAADGLVTDTAIDGYQIGPDGKLNES